MIHFEAIFVIFILGALLGWILELFYRRFVTMKKWVNPGFLLGPYLPIYGVGMIMAFFVCEQNFNENYYFDLFIKLMIFLTFSTLLELIGGIILEKIFHKKLWNYQNKKGNLNGFICITYSFLWALLGLIYYLFFHRLVYSFLVNLFKYNLVFFFVGAIFGIILIDLNNHCFKKKKNNH